MYQKEFHAFFLVLFSGRFLGQTWHVIFPSQGRTHHPPWCPTCSSLVLIQRISLMPWRHSMWWPWIALNLGIIFKPSTFYDIACGLLLSIQLLENAGFLGSSTPCLPSLFRIFIWVQYESNVGYEWIHTSFGISLGIIYIYITILTHAHSTS